MNTLPTNPDRARSRELNELADAMDVTDQELYAAERADDRTLRIALLLERSRQWRSYGKLLEQAGREAWVAHGCARRDRSEALRLQAEAEARG
jgi:hypothetical protein